MPALTFHTVDGKGIGHVMQSVEKEMLEALARKKKRMDDTLLGILLLMGGNLKAKLEVNRYTLDYGPVIHVTETSDWSVIHNALGKLKNEGISPAPNTDGRKRLVDVRLCPEDEQFKNITFIYRKQLPKPDKRKGVTGQPKCRLVTVTRKETRLVCDDN